MAEEISQRLGADIEEIVVEQPYEGDFEQTVQRSQKERETGEIPKIKPLEKNPEEYDVVLLGYPVWFGTYALPVAGLIQDYDLSGKRIVPFCTFGSGGVESSVGDLRKALPQTQVSDGYGVRTIRLKAMPEEVERFLIEQGLLEGTLEELEEYSEQQPVTEEEAALFEEACGDYQFPLGTPVTVGKRPAKEGEDYRFSAKAVTPEGQEAMFTIYVVKKEGEKAEFTRVVR